SCSALVTSVYRKRWRGVSACGLNGPPRFGRTVRFLLVLMCSKNPFCEFKSLVFASAASRIGRSDYLQHRCHQCQLARSAPSKAASDEDRPRATNSRLLKKLIVPVSPVAIPCRRLADFVPYICGALFGSAPIQDFWLDSSASGEIEAYSRDAQSARRFV